MGKKVDLNAPQKAKTVHRKPQANNKPRENKEQNNEDAQNKQENNSQQPQDNEQQQTNNNQQASNKKNANNQELSKSEQVGKEMAKKAIASKTGNTIANSKMMDKALDKAIVKLRVVNKITLIFTILTILSPILLLIMLAVAIATLFSGDSESGAGAFGGYYPIDCKEVTIIKVDENYEPVGNETYDLEEYVAGVINNEVGMFGNLEVYKQFAIAARTYFVKNKDSDCTIEASDRKQTFSEVTDATPNGSMMKQAAEETKGQVLLDKDGNLINSEYDAFCSIAVDDNYYTVKQQNQKIPREWVDSQSGIAAAWKKGDCTGNHGRGMSQWGSYYLATEEDYTYDKLIAYYLGSEIGISADGFTSSVAGLEIKVTTNASYELNQPIDTYLQSKGSSLEEYNRFIKENVEKAGVGTREGVVTAAVSVINYLYDNYNAKLPYYWGGHPNTIGIPNTFGTNNPSTSSSGRVYSYVSFDCSGFVGWAIKNGGYNISDGNAASYISRFPGCNINSSSCKGQAGDLIATTAHIVMIVSVDEENNRYFVAESTGSGVIIQPHSMHENVYGNASTVLHMDDYYKNSSNVNTNY